MASGTNGTKYDNKIHMHLYVCMQEAISMGLGEE